MTHPGDPETRAFVPTDQASANEPILSGMAESPSEASEGDDVVGEGEPVPVPARSLALAGFEQFGVPFVGAQVERGQRLLGFGPRPGTNRGVVDDQQEAAGRHGSRRLLQDVDAGKLYRRVQVLGGDQVEGARWKGEGEVVLPEVDAVGDAC